MLSPARATGAPHAAARRCSGLGGAGGCDRRDLRRLGHEKAIDQREEAVVEALVGQRLAGHLDQRVVAGRKRQRQRTERADAHAGRVVDLLQAVAVLQRAGEGDGAAGAAALARADHAQLDFHMHLAGRLEALAAGRPDRRWPPSPGSPGSAARAARPRRSAPASRDRCACGWWSSRTPRGRTRRAWAPCRSLRGRARTAARQRLRENGRRMEAWKTSRRC